MTGDVDVSVLLPFADDEERVGRAVRHLAAHLSAQGQTFEILAADEGAGDNSVALLGWLARAELPSLSLLAAEPGAGFAAAAAVARGRVLWFVDVATADGPLAPFARANARLRADDADLIFAGGRFALARRARLWPVACDVHGRGASYARRLRRRALLADLRVEDAGVPPALAAGSGAHRVPVLGSAFAHRAQVWKAVLATYVGRR